jgi:probable rRNA maturation factor
MVTLQVKRKVKLIMDKTILVRAAQFTLDFENVNTQSDMSIVIGDDTLLKKLNQKYRSIDATTDVLSFPSNEPDPDTDSIYLGDVVISLPRAQDQASTGGYPLAEELQLLVVHGTLHLLGYDHQRKSDKKRMQAIQDNVLTQLDVKLLNTL